MSRVLIRKLDGFPIEFQSGDAPLGTLLQNAINAGLDEDDYEEQNITDLDYAVLEEDKINQPIRAEQEARNAQKRIRQQQAVSRIKIALNLSDSEIQDLRDALI